MASPGLAVWMAPSASAEQPRDGRPVVEVDHDRRGAAGGDGVRLGIVPDERGHLVAVLVQIRQYMRSDEAGRAGECYFHGRSLLHFEAWTCSFNQTLDRDDLNCQVKYGLTRPTFDRPAAVDSGLNTHGIPTQRSAVAIT